MMENYNHLIKIDEITRLLVIYRVYEDGRQELFTEVELPAKTVDENEDQFERFSCLLGENLLLDSPIARKLLGL